MYIDYTWEWTEDLLVYTLQEVFFKGLDKNIRILE